MTSSRVQSQTLRSAVFPASTALTHSLFLVGGVLFLSALAQIAIPVPGSPVPVTGQTLGVFLIATTYGARLATATFATYLLAAIAGAPLFAPSATLPSHGLARITSATGGYLIGMLIKCKLFFVKCTLIYRTVSEYGKESISSRYAR